MLLVLVFIIFPLVNSQYSYVRPACPKNLSLEQFVLNFDSGREIQCNFKIFASSSRVCKIGLNFKQFTLISSPYCRDEYLEIDGKKFCGSLFGWQNFSLSEKSTAVTLRGLGRYPIEIEAQQFECPQKLSCDLVSSQVETEITSPNFPNPYSAPARCFYTITTPDVCQISIKFLDFYLPESPKCTQSRFLIDNQPFCGSQTGLTLSKNVFGAISLQFSASVSHSFGKFRILVERKSCLNSTSRQAQSFPTCCGHPFSSQSTVVTSPGFLNHPSNSFACSYFIVPYQPSVCRLRINFHHFWLGDEDIYYGCTNGFLEIDGKKICGCKDGVFLYAYFNGGPKEIIYSGGPSSRGFVIELIQEDCGQISKSFPEATTENPNTEVEIFTINSTEKFESRFFVPTDNSRCYQWGAPNWLEKVNGVLSSLGAERCTINSSPTLPISPAPIFPSPEFPVLPVMPSPTPPVIPPPLVPSYPVNPILPPPSYPVNPIIPPSSRPVNPILPPPSYPVNPIIPPPSYPVNPIIPPPSYPVNPIIPPSSRPVNPILPPLLYPVNPIIPPPPSSPSPPNPYGCHVYHTVVGSIRSPNYPWGYPPMLRLCYRIRQFLGFCRVQLVFLDFQLEWSPKCIKDFVFTNRRDRYCGISRQPFYVDLEFQNGYAYVDFLTNQFLNNRGFDGFFRQIPCQIASRSQCDIPSNRDEHFNTTTITTTPVPNDFGCK